MMFDPPAFCGVLGVGAASAVGMDNGGVGENILVLELILTFSTTIMLFVLHICVCVIYCYDFDDNNFLNINASVEIAKTIFFKNVFIHILWNK